MSQETTSDSKNIRILLVHSYELVLDAMRALLNAHPGITVVAEARNRREALDGLRAEPDVILIELDLDTESGLDILTDLRKVMPHPRVVVITGSQDKDHHIRAACMGAMGIVLKQEGANLLVKAIRKVHLGEIWMNRSTIAEAMAQLQDLPAVTKDPDALKIESLTTRERSVIALLGEGLRNKEIAERLFISEKTVRHYLTSIFAKLGVTDRLELMIFAYQEDLARLPARRAAVNAHRTDVSPRSIPTNVLKV